MIWRVRYCEGSGGCCVLCVGAGLGVSVLVVEGEWSGVEWSGVEWSEVEWVWAWACGGRDRTGTERISSTEGRIYKSNVCGLFLVVEGTRGGGGGERGVVKKKGIKLEEEKRTQETKKPFPKTKTQRNDSRKVAWKRRKA